MTIQFVLCVRQQLRGHPPGGVPEELLCLCRMGKRNPVCVVIQLIRIYFQDPVLAGRCDEGRCDELRQALLTLSDVLDMDVSLNVGDR